MPDRSRGRPRCSRPRTRRWQPARQAPHGCRSSSSFPPPACASFPVSRHLSARAVAKLYEDKKRARVRLSALAALVARFYGPRPDALRPPDLRYASEMIGLIRRAMSSWIVLGLLGLVLRSEEHTSELQSLMR